MNNRYNHLASANEVNGRIDAVANQIITDFPTTPLFVELLHGAAPFASRLMFAVARKNPEYHPEMKSMIVSTYGNGQKAGEPHIVTDLPPDTIISGRDVVVVDDVLDKGVTADFVFKHLHARSAKSVSLAVLCDKQTSRIKDVKAAYVGFHFKDNWLVGMGMDDSGAATEGYRWLDEIWEIKQ